MKNLCLILLDLFIFSALNSSGAAEKFYQYFSASLTKESNTLIKNFACPESRNYKIQLYFVNYSDSASTLAYRLDANEFRTISIAGLKSNNELIDFYQPPPGAIKLEIKASALADKPLFISCDVVILLDD